MADEEENASDDDIGGRGSETRSDSEKLSSVLGQERFSARSPISEVVGRSKMREAANEAGVVFRFSDGLCKFR